MLSQAFHSYLHVAALWHCHTCCLLNRPHLSDERHRCCACQEDGQTHSAVPSKSDMLLSVRRDADLEGMLLA